MRRRGDAALIFDEANPAAVHAAEQLSQACTFVELEGADVGVVLGGDGFMLRTLHRFLAEERALPVYGMNLGTVGFLLNRFGVDDLAARISQADPTVLHPLRMRALHPDGTESVQLAVNEVSLLRASAQSARLRIDVDGATQVDDLYADGALVATAAGSTAYNRSAGGPIIPLSARLLTLTPLAGFRPRGWRGALLDATTCVRLNVVDADRRPVHAAADHREVGRVVAATVEEASDISLVLLFDRNHTLESRILREQFR